MLRKDQLQPAEISSLFKILKSRFEKNSNRFEGLKWETVQAKLESNPDKIWSLNQMELSGGEPDMVSYNRKSNEFVFYDCAAESPTGRRSCCYDRQALESRKANKPQDSALDYADEMGVDLLNETQYAELQQLGEFDLKTSSWIKTPSEIRKLGGAIFGDRRFGRVFIYHNGAESYYAARGFRTSLTV